MALGDIAFEGKNADQPDSAVFSSVSSVFKKADLVVGNLENPLIEDARSVPNKCVMRASTGWAEVMQRADIGVLSLANNHMMDFGTDGLFCTMAALEERRIKFVGAGRDVQEARAPIFIDLKGMRIAFLARSSVIVTSPSYATKDQPGVAFMDEDETILSLSECSRQADFVIIMMHWGLENYQLPSLGQRKLSQRLIAAGANLIIGHHPHVMQGVERINNGLVCYSLGNFVFDDFSWTFTNREGEWHEVVSQLSENERKGAILSVAIEKNRIVSHDWIPTKIVGGGVLTDSKPARMKEMKRLSSRLKRWPYGPLWKGYALKREWKLRIEPQFRGKLSWKYLKKVRFGHFSQLIRTVRKSSRISLEKSTNPYD